MLCCRWNPKNEKKKLNIHIYYFEKEENTMNDIENSEPKDRRKREKICDLRCFDKGNDVLVKDQIKTPGSAVSGSQLIMLSFNKNHEKPYETIYVSFYN
jgi:hypothetical protein